MGSKTKIARRPLTDSETNLESDERDKLGGEDMNGVVQKISLENVSHEDRRREAKKPLYLVRYE